MARRRDRRRRRSGRGRQHILVHPAHTREGNRMSSVRSAPTIVNPDLGRPIHILLVEDSPSDVAMTIEALREGLSSTRRMWIGRPRSGFTIVGADLTLLMRLPSLVWAG